MKTDFAAGVVTGRRFGIDLCQPGLEEPCYSLPMITLDDIEDMTCLTREEIAALAEPEALPELNASALADYLTHVPKGPQNVQRMICKDIRKALRADDLPHAKSLYAILHHFLIASPEAAPGAAPD